MYSLDKLIIYSVVICILISSCFLNYKENAKICDLSVSICIYLLTKWITDYRKCTFGYLECKIRNVKKEKGYINNLLEPVFDINKLNNAYIIYSIIFIILCINYYKKTN